MKNKGKAQKQFRLLSDCVDARLLADGKRTIVVTITRMGRFYDPRYGEFEISRDLCEGMVRNFNANAYGQDIAVDRAHKPNEEGSGGYFKSLFIEGSKLRGELELNEFGIELIAKKGYRYLSADYVENFVDNEERKEWGPVLRGAALCVRPVIKRLDPIMLAEDDGHPVWISPKVAKQLTEEFDMTLKELVDKYRAKIKGLKLAESVAAQLVSTFEKTAKQLGDDDEALNGLLTTFEESAKNLAESIGDKEVTLKIDIPAAPQPGKTLSEDDVNALLEKKLADTAKKAADDAKLLQETKDAKAKVLSETITAATGISETAKAEMVKELGELITPEMSDDQIKRLCEHAIKKANDIEVARQLSNLGFQTTQGGTPYITVDDSNTVKQLQETVDKRLGLADMPDEERFAKTGGKLLAANKAFADKVLAMYDAEHAPQLRQEAKQLAGGDGVVADVAVPSSWERTVIREALYGLKAMTYLNSGTALFNETLTIPYSYRDTTAAGRSDTRKYEGQSIARAGMIQTSETAYRIPQKLAFEVSNELRYLTQAQHIMWDAVIENQRNATRIIGEDLEHLSGNEVLQASDEFGATAVVDEALTAQVDGTNNVFNLANFPVVRPRSVFTSAGALVGNVSNPVTVTLGGVDIDEYDGTGDQAAGNYYTLDYNHGQVRIVDEAGALQTPAGATALLVDYSYATNVVKFDTDNGAVDVDLYWNDFLYKYGLRKAVLKNQRFYMPNFGLMTETVKTQIEQAKQFAANFARPGTDLTADGDLGRIKAIPNFSLDAPGLWMGDQRVIIGERGITRFRMMKPWTMGQLQDQRDANGRFVGKQEAYGEQYIVIHTPTQLKQAYTSMVLFSTTARAVQVE